MKQFRIIPLDERILFDAAAMVDLVQQVESNIDAISADQSESGDPSNEKPSKDNESDSTQAAKKSSEHESRDTSDHGIEGLSLAQTIDPAYNQVDGVRVLVVSSEIRDATALTQAALDGVKIVYYDASTTSTEMLTAKIAQTLDGEKADSIAFAGFGEADGFHLTQGKVISAETIENDLGLQRFWNEVGSMVEDDGRVDILACNLVSTDKGLQLIAQIDQVLDHDDDGSDIKIAASEDLTGSAAAGGDWILEKGGVDVAKTYFNAERLSIWNQVLDSTAYQVENINPFGNSDPNNFVDVNGVLYFTATNGSDGVELWKSDGTASGTAIVKDIYTGYKSSSPANLTNVDGTLFFTATTAASGTELWKSDGTSAGTELVKEIRSGSSSSSPQDLTSAGGVLYFSARDDANGREIWRSDGTSSGTYMIKNIASGSSSSSPSDFTAVGSKVFFVADTSDKGKELWVTDGTTTGTVLVKDIDTGSKDSDPTHLINLNGTLFFTADDGDDGRELWKSDGTSSGTVLVKDIRSGSSSSSISEPTVMGDAIYFAARGTSDGIELWKSDGTSSGTVMVKDIQTGSGSSTPSNFLVVNNTLYFAAASSGSNVELWKSDGTTAGTVLVKDVEAGAGVGPQSLTSFDGKIYFTATTTDKGTEIWVTDGTSSGTVLVKDINTGTSNSSPASLTVSGSTLYFSATDGSTGNELWALGHSNDAPVNQIPDTASVNEDGVLTFSSANGNQISISDADAGSSLMQVTLTASNGTMSLSGTTGLTFTTGSGTSSSSMVFTGTAANINAALNGLTFSPTANFNGAASISLTTNDQGNTGTGGAKSDADVVAITVSAVNDAPVNQISATASVNEDGVLKFSAANNNQISITDVDSSSSVLQVTLVSTNGTMSLNGATGLTFSTGSGTNSSNMVFTGTAANINTALNGLTFSPTVNFNGAASISLTTNDQGNTGSGGVKSDADVVAVTVNAVNDAPVNQIPATASVNEDSVLTFSSVNGNQISISDVDSSSSVLQVTLASTNGTMSLNGTTGLTFSTGSGTNSSNMVFTGTAANIR